MIITGIPFFMRSVVINEQSGNAGGLPQWPAKSLIMIGFALLFFQGVSELIKRIAVMRGLIPDPHETPGPARSKPKSSTSSRPSKNNERPQRESGVIDMTAFFIDNMAPIMFVALVVFLLLGYPAAFSLGAVGLIFGLIGIELGLFAPDFLQALPERIYGVMSNDMLLAIPFFTFMGLVLERSGMAEDLLDTIGQLFGTVRGGLAYAVVFVGALLAATTGVVAASVISMGLISLPIMLRYGYDRRVASGVIAASGTLAQIIPPSLVLIVMADQLGRSVGDMYEGAFIPGLVLAGLYALYIFIVSILYPEGGARPAGRGSRLPRAGRQPRPDLARRSGRSPSARVRLVRSMRQFGTSARRRLRRAEHVLRHPVRVRASRCVNWLTSRFIGFRFPVAHGAADHLRDGAAAVPDLPRARHHLHRRRDADRRRRHGRDRRADPRRC